MFSGEETKEDTIGEVSGFGFLGRENDDESKLDVVGTVKDDDLFTTSKINVDRDNIGLDDFDILNRLEQEIDEPNLPVQAAPEVAAPDLGESLKVTEDFDFNAYIASQTTTGGGLFDD